MDANLKKNEIKKYGWIKSKPIVKIVDNYRG